MIFGSGLVARQLKDIHLPDGYAVYARGVSDSTSCSLSDFKKDKRLLIEALNSEVKIIYISSQACADISNSSFYITHKRDLEQLVLSASDQNVVFRLPQICGKGGNPTNLINFMSTEASNGKALKVYSSAKRNLVRGSDICGLVRLICETGASGVISFCAPYTYFAIEIALVILDLVGNEDASIVEVSESSNTNFSFVCSKIFDQKSNQIRNLGRQIYLRNALEEVLS